MPELMAWLEASALGDFMRESGRWTYGIFNLLHVLGIALLFGAIAVLDLKLLGAWRRIPVTALSEPIVPISGFGLLLALGSGVALLSAQATEYVGNPFLLIKFAAIALGVINVGALHMSSVWREMRHAETSTRGRRRLAWAGALSLISWLVAIGAGRMIAYW